MAGFTIMLFLVFSQAVNSQKVIYTEPDKNEMRQIDFEIIGKYTGNYLIYKNIRGAGYISVYDADMKLKSNETLKNVGDRLMEADFVAYPDFVYMFYQYQKKSVIYCKMVKLGTDGKELSQPIDIDTTQVGGSNSDRIYSVITSEDKQKILVFKINSRDERRYIFKTLLFDKEMNLLHLSRTDLKMSDRNDFLTDFNLDNDGNMVFGRGLRPGSSENIIKFWLVIKPAVSDTFGLKELKLEGVSLDEVKLRVDNNNNRYLFTGFYYKGKRIASIEGISNAIYDKPTGDWVIKNLIPLGSELREDARGENNIKNAFDDYYIKNITIRKDGGFVVIAESNYQTTRGNPYNFNRWGNMYSPYFSGYDYYRYGAYSPYGWNRWNTGSVTRYHADNIVIGAFDKEGKLTLTNTIRKSQFDDDNEAMVSYLMVNTGDALRFLYNDYEKRDVILTYQNIDADGNITRPPTMKNLDKGYSFLPRLGKQVSAHTTIIPCIYRNYLCFAKLDF
jgi:hypothetical protein